jgi:MtN3 and saliva related transmembrane protein
MSAAVVGTIAAMFSVASFVPQAWRIVKTRSTKGLATPMWILNTIGFALWVGYGALLGALPIIVPNAICFGLAAFILTRVVKCRRTASP